MCMAQDAAEKAKEEERLKADLESQGVKVGGPWWESYGVLALK